MVHHIYEKYVNELAKDTINDTINVNDTINDNNKNITKEKNTIVVPIMPLLQLNPKIAVNVPPK